jgi:hypothetical protein
VLALLITSRLYMDSNEYPKDLPPNLRPEFDKYKQDPKKYARMYPVCMRLLLKYIGTPNGKK